MFWCEHGNTKKHVSEHSWLSGWVIFNILDHLAHCAQSYFSLILIFDLTNKKIVKCLVKSDQCLRLFSSRRQSPLLIVLYCSIVFHCIARPSATSACLSGSCLSTTCLSVFGRNELPIPSIVLTYVSFLSSDVKHQIFYH